MIDPENIPSYVQWRDEGELGLSVWNFITYGLRMDIDALAALATLFSPTFVVRRECVLLADNSDGDDFDSWWQRTGGDRHAVEAQLNHVHVRDLLGVPTENDELLAEISSTIADCWRAGLGTTYPDRSFIVETVTSDEDSSGPIIRFWQA